MEDTSESKAHLISKDLAPFLGGDWVPQPRHFW